MPNYFIVNMGEYGHDTKYYCLDIAVCNKNSVIKRVFIDHKTYKKLNELFGDAKDMVTFDIGQYVYYSVRNDGSIELKLFDELIQAI